MTTLTNLLAICRLTCPSATDWPDATLTAWIQDAIRLHSAAFPRRRRYTITLATGTQTYNLPADCKALLSVEYPSGQTPRSYLTHVDEGSSRFAAADNVYALRGVATSSSDAVPGVLVFAETVATGQSAIVEYIGDHAVPSTGSDVLTVPDSQLEALIAFVEFRAHWELETDEAFAISNVSVVLAQLGENARRAWNRYKEVVAHLEALRHDLPLPPIVWRYD